jgi:hypothetical protein
MVWRSVHDCIAAFLESSTSLPGQQLVFNSFKKGLPFNGDLAEPCKSIGLSLGQSLSVRAINRYSAVADDKIIRLYEWSISLRLRSSTKWRGRVLHIWRSCMSLRTRIRITFSCLSFSLPSVFVRQNLGRVSSDLLSRLSDSAEKQWRTCSLSRQVHVGGRSESGKEVLGLPDCCTKSPV